MIKTLENFNKSSNNFSKQTAKMIPIRLTSLLSLVFFFSGFASLIYQVVWQRLLTVHYGVGAISIALIVSIYMLGLGVGALFGGLLAERIKNKIILYFVIELLIGCFGLISLLFLDFLGRHTSGSSYLISFFYMFLFLCVPTLLMGTTLPLLTKIFNRLIKNFLNTVSFLYFINTLGAASGTIFSSYVLISFFGLDTALYFAVIINFILAVLILLAKYFPLTQQEREYRYELHEDPDSILGKIAYLFVFITGFLAIGYEIIWFRVVGVLVKASPYAFSSVLSVYLLGIALGSFGMSKYLKKPKTINKKSLFFTLQFLIGVYIMANFIGYLYSTKYTFLNFFTKTSFSTILHPSFEITSFLSLGGFLKDLYSSIDIFLWPLAFVFIPTLFMGASFPLISYLALSKPKKEGKTVGTVYFFNISGNVLGGIFTGFLLLPLLSTEITLLIFSSVGVLFGLFISNFRGKKLAVAQRLIVVLLLLVVAATFFPKRTKLYETMHICPGKEFDAYLEEGVDGIIVTCQHGERVENYINGLPHGRRPGPLYYSETIETASFARKVENVLIIGYGTGSFTETILKMDDVQKVTLVEISSTLIKNLKKMKVFREMLSDSRLELITDDGRRFLLRTHEKFDLILMDPLRTTTAYSNNLYSQQFFELIDQHLEERGILFVTTGKSRVLQKTVLSAFKYMRVYKFFCLASKHTFKRSQDREQRLLAKFSPQERSHILKSRLRFLGSQVRVKKITVGYPINQDWKPVCEYYLGLRVKEKFFLRK